MLDMNIRKLRSWHKYLSLSFGIIIFFYALSGIILNHRSLFANITINRNYLPSNYLLRNWSQATVRSKINLNKNERLIFGTIGVWKTDLKYNTFTDFNQGLPTGIDYKKSFDLKKTSKGTLFLATENGIYARALHHDKWSKLPTDSISNQRIYSLQEIDGSLFFMNRNSMFSINLDFEERFNSTAILDNIIIQSHHLIPPKEYNNDLSLFRTLWFIHSGEIFGPIGKFFVDVLSILMMILIFTGFFFIFYKYFKRKKLLKKNLTSLKVTLRTLHLRLGSWLAILFTILAITGSFLRPPFLILISDIEIPKIPGTHFSNDNIWFEKLRGFYYDSDDNSFYIFTGKGEILHTANLVRPLKKLHNLPPISIMGMNHFSKLTSNQFLIGSFSGLFIWNKNTGSSINFFTKQRFVKPKRASSPVSDYLVTGFFTEGNVSHYFDFSKGSTTLNKGIMPNYIKEKSPMSLWTLALEIHTGRFLSQYLGPFFLLYVPFSGLVLTIILFVGFLLWFKGYRKPSK